MLVPPGISDEKKKNQPPENEQDQDTWSILPQLRQSIQNPRDHSGSLHHDARPCHHIGAGR